MQRVQRYWTVWYPPQPGESIDMKTVTGPTDRVVVIGAGLAGLS